MSTSDTVRAQSRKDPGQLEHEIDQQRDHIGEIIHALENKLSPGEIFDKVLGNGKGGREFAGNLAQTVKNNPMPTLLTVAGLAWLYAGSGRSHASTHVTTTATTSASDKPGLGERVGHAREQVSSKLGSAKQRVGDSTHHAMDSARMKARRGKEGLAHMLDDNPMAIGAMAIAAGALLGALLPSTRKEDELMGPMRDRLADDAKHAARSGYDKVAESGREVTQGEHASAGTAQSSTAPSTTTSSSGTSPRPGL